MLTRVARGVLGLLLLSSLGTGGCASIIVGRTQVVRFTCDPQEARYELVSKKGEVVHRGTTPETVTLKRGRGFFLGADLTMNAWKEGYERAEKPIHMYVNLPYAVGNLIFGGAIGYLILDPITGAMFSFPEKVHVNLTKTGSQQP